MFSFPRYIPEGTCIFFREYQAFLLWQLHCLYAFLYSMAESVGKVMNAAPDEDSIPFPSVPRVLPGWRGSVVELRPMYEPVGHG